MVAKNIVKKIKNTMNKFNSKLALIFGNKPNCKYNFFRCIYSPRYV